MISSGFRIRFLLAGSGIFMRVILNKFRFQDKILASGFRDLMRVVLDKRRVQEVDKVKTLMRGFLDKT